MLVLDKWDVSVNDDKLDEFLYDNWPSFVSQVSRTQGIVPV